ncbi:hypothetical protein UCDDS831_g03195 [Diplodia seriata]|uniref:Uncharacterized protein n=1 Tax=Diplodia seriata TaxID=420778 RepID=A0A0G2H2R0_9PEZI|nr:hypothetical protein UCDDS831_g03195 [Diplodia seriata]
MAYPTQQPPAYQEGEASKLPEAQSYSVELPTPSTGEPFRSRSSTMGGISKPIVIPQTINMFYVRSFSPFARAYAPALATLPQPIDQDDFLAFIDGLNDAFMMHPFFQAGFVAGGAVMSAPILPVQIAGGGLQALAALGSGAVTLVRVKGYLKKANAELFAPRGLAVRTCTTKRMLRAVGRGGEKKLSFHGGDNTNNTNANDNDDVIDVDALLAEHHAATLPAAPPPRSERRPGLGLHSRSASAASAISTASTASTAEQHASDLHKRRLRALSGAVEPVTFDVPAAPLPANALKRYTTAPTRWMNGRSARSLAAGREKGMQQRRDKAAELDGELAAVKGEIEGLERLAAEEEVELQRRGYGGGGLQELEGEGWEQHGVVGGSGAAGHQRNASRELAVSLEKRAHMIEEIRKAGEKKIKKSDKKEEKMANRVLWIVITRLENAPPEEDELELSDEASQTSH